MGRDWQRMEGYIFNQIGSISVYTVWSQVIMLRLHILGTTSRGDFGEGSRRLLAGVLANTGAYREIKEKD